MRDLLRKARRKLSSLLLVDTCILEGPEKHSGQSLRIFFGGGKPDRGYIAHIAFKDRFTTIEQGRHFVWTALKLAADKSTCCDVQVVVTHRVLSRYLQGGKGFHIPGWLGTEVDLAHTDALTRTSKSLKWDLRKVKRNGFEYEITNDRALYDYFYEKMYLPYINNVYGDRSFVTSYSIMMSQLQRCELGFVKKNGEYLAGGIIIFEGNEARGWSLGVLDGNKELVKQGVIAALYYFETRYLLQRGFTKRSMGSSRGFLQDGVLKFKKKWGAKLTSAKPMGFLVKPVKNSRPARAFLEHNPFVFEQRGKIRGAVFLASDSCDDMDRRIKVAYQEIFCEGLSGLSIYCFGGVQPSLALEPEIRDRIELRSAAPIFDLT